MNEGLITPFILLIRTGAVFLIVIVVAVLSYRYFAVSGDVGSPGEATRNPSRQNQTRGRQVTPAMVEVFIPDCISLG